MSANAISLPLTDGCVGANGDTNGDIIGDMHVTVLSKGWGRGWQAVLWAADEPQIPS